MKKEYDFDSAISIEFSHSSKLNGYNEAVQCLRQKSNFLADVASIFSGEATQAIPTACVVFSSISGTPLSVKFNYGFWSKLNLQERAAIIAHEMLHVILNHGKRQIDLLDKKLANIAMDICVNEILDSEFQINPEYAAVLKEAVYLDKIDPNLEKGRCFEYYYKNISKESISDFTSIDIHDWMNAHNIHPSDIDQMIERMKKNGLDMKSIFDLIKKLRLKHGGSEPGILEKIFEKNDLSEYRKARWSKVIKKIIKKVELNYVNDDDWFRSGRRQIDNEEFIIPFNETLDEVTAKRNIHMFLDTSGSCSEWSNSFLGSALYFPNNNYNVNLYSFDTRIYKINAKKPKLNGFGGTSFDSISRYVNDTIKKYDAIIVLTDGYGDNSIYKKPKLWHWIMTTDYTQLIPSSSNIYALESIV